ncbi:MAG TPA: C45 family autoproteolytic acyltransferase/hydrolase, partial [Kofleriaceae bacterium]|nr:C45 family autoproteolytic acyltransferase/hydrolase [Kofleriaceae bacterium]
MIAVALLGVAVVVTWFIYRRSVAYEMPGGEVRGEITQQATPGVPPALVFGTASLAWTGGLPVLRVVGDDHAIGAAHGRLLAPWLAATAAAAAPSIEGTVGPGGWFGGSTHGMRLAWRWRFIDNGLLDPDRRMVAGMTRGAAASGVELAFEDLVRGQAVLDVGEPSPRTAEADDHSIARSLTIIARPAAAPARLWIGRAFALPGLDDGGDAATPVVTIAHPEGRISWASVGWPGALGVVTGVNAHGIAVMVNPVRTADVRVTRPARPVPHLARGVLEAARTLDEAVKLIETTPTLGAAAIALADATGAWILVERTPTRAIVERNPRAPVVGDVLTTNALAGDPENDRARRMLTTATRIERAGKLVRAPLPDVGALAGVLRDRRTPDDAVRPIGHRGVIDDGRAVHVAILDPATLELWVGDPRAGGRMRGF